MTAHSTRPPRSPAQPRSDQRAAPANGTPPPRPGARGTAQEAAIARFLRSFQLLVKSTRLYDRNHPQVQEHLAASEEELRSAQGGLKSRTVAVRVESGRFFAAGSERSGAAPLADPRDELKSLAEELSRRGVSTLTFLPETHHGDLSNLAALLVGKPPQPSAQMRRAEAAEADAGKEKEKGAPETDPGSEAADWPGRLRVYFIEGVRVNQPFEEPRADATAAGLVALVLHEVAGPGAGGAAAGPAAESQAELFAAFGLLAQVGAVLAASAGAGPQQAAVELRSAVAAAEPGARRAVQQALARHAPQAGEPLDGYLERLAEAMTLDFAAAQLQAGRIAARDARPLLAIIARQLLAPIAFGPARSAAPPLLHPQWSEESWLAHIEERFWAGLHAAEKSAVLHSRDAWCVPVAVLRSYVEPALGGNEASRREARAALLDYSRGLIGEETPGRLTAATGLIELRDIIERLWPEELPEDLVARVVFALVDEKTPEVAGLLTGVTANLAQHALDCGRYEDLEHILAALEKCPRDGEHAHIRLLAQRLLQPARWDALVTASLEPRHLDSSLVAILGRDPERLLDSLGARLAAGQLQSLPAMARLVRAVGEPVLGALATHLFDPRQQRASSAVKLLAATRADRLLEALPRALPGWDWNLQDLAVSELISTGGGARGPHLLARVFLAAAAHAHPLVVPMMLDQIGLAKEAAAVPLLMELAAGRHERLKDVFVRIKAVEALGRIGPACGAEAATLLRAILREKRGLTHAEPAGLRAAAEEALGLIENWPSSARVRTAREALEKAGMVNAPPRRYLRISLDSPLDAVILGPPAVSARVRTISLGGAFLESGRRMNVGDAVEVEIKTGLRRILGKAVVRNIHPTGTGVEFVHMKQDDREKLRRLVSKLLRE